MNKTISTFIFAAVLAIFTFSTLPAQACPGVKNCTKCESKVEKKCNKNKVKEEKKCKKDCTKPCCVKSAEKKCNKNKATPSHEDASRYND